MDRAAQWVRAWKPAVPWIHEVFHARFVDHAYPSHTHNAWTVFTVDEGSIAYDLERRHRGVAGSKVTLLPPGLVHDGRPGAVTGYRKRVLYVGIEVLGEHLIGPAVDRPDVLDPSLFRGFRSLRRALASPDDAFEAGSLFARVAARLARHLGDAGGDHDADPSASIADDLRDLLDARLSVGVTLTGAGARSRRLTRTPGPVVHPSVRAPATPLRRRTPHRRRAPSTARRTAAGPSGRRRRVPRPSPLHEAFQATRRHDARPVRAGRRELTPSRRSERPVPPSRTPPAVGSATPRSS